MHDEHKLREGKTFRTVSEGGISFSKFSRQFIENYSIGQIFMFGGEY